MCGIAGIKPHPSHLNSTHLNVQLTAMADSLVHRGPDAEGFFNDAHIGLAHRRLSIIDLAGGAQPMQTCDGRLVLTFNGEIFNYLELRQSLQARGYIFHSQSDTEVILHLYREYGLGFVTQLNGQFAIGLWDADLQQLILVRDRVGICPLYYSMQQGDLLFASEIKAIAAALPDKLTLNTQALDHIFTGWTCLEPDTIFADIYQVSPGTLMVVDAHNQITTKTYWSLCYPQHRHDYDDRSESVLVDELAEHLINATQIRLRADVPVGAYLSGGLDSSVLVALMHQTIPDSLRTFSLGFDDPAVDESLHQQQVVAHLGTRHSQINISNGDIAAALEQSVYHTESPLLRTAPVPMGLLSGHVQQQGFRVVLTGEGADEVLGGYDIFKEAKVRQFWAKYPESQRRPMLLNRLYPYMELPKGNATGYLQRFFGVGLDSPELLWHSHLPRWQTTSKAKLFYSDALKSRLRDDFETRVAQLFPPEAAHWHPLNRAQFLETKTLMSGYLLTSQGDRMLTRHSIEGRFPYLDHKLIEFANQVPPKLKLKGLSEKNLLRKLAHRYLPANISQRPKQPYRAPNAAASQTALFTGPLLNYLDPDNLVQHNLFDAGKVALLIKKAQAGRGLNTSESQALTGILTTQILLQQFC
jgi:asparagine synthase (glutamine-hydrolysing)